MIFAYYLHDLSPFVIKFTDKIAVHWYGLAYVLGFYLTYRVMYFLAKRGLSEIKPEAVADFITLVSLFGLVLAVGIVGFPLLFETQPRPIPVDIPIEIPRKDGAPALPMPPLRSAAPKASAPLVPSRDEALPTPAVEVARETPVTTPAPASGSSSSHSTSGRVITPRRAALDHPQGRVIARVAS